MNPETDFYQELTKLLNRAAKELREREKEDFPTLKAARESLAESWADYLMEEHGPE